MNVVIEIVQSGLERQELGRFFARHMHDVSPDVTVVDGLPQYALDLIVQLSARDPSTGELVGGAQLVPDGEFAAQLVARLRPGAISPAQEDAVYLDLARQIRSLTHVAVAPQVRQRALGQTLINEAIAATAGTGVTFIYGFADGDLAALRRFYTACGFTARPVGEPLRGALPGPLGELELATRRHGFWFHT